MPSRPTTAQHILPAGTENSSLFPGRCQTMLCPKKVPFWNSAQKLRNTTKSWVKKTKSNKNYIILRMKNPPPLGGGCFFVSGCFLDFMCYLQDFFTDNSSNRLSTTFPEEFHPCTAGPADIANWVILLVGDVRGLDKHNIRVPQDISGRCLTSTVSFDCGQLFLEQVGKSFGPAANNDIVRCHDVRVDNLADIRTSSSSTWARISVSSATCWRNSSSSSFILAISLSLAASARELSNNSLSFRWIVLSLLVS